MNKKQTAFTVEYVKDHNATQAAIRAGYSPKSAYSQANDLLKKHDIQEAIKDLEDAASVRSGITVDTIVRRLDSIASNPDARDADRIKADELLGKFLGMFTDKVRVEGQIDTNVTKLDGILDQLKE